jgi:uncharacterized membrane protein
LQKPESFQPRSLSGRSEVGHFGFSAQAWSFDNQGFVIKGKERTMDQKSTLKRDVVTSIALGGLAGVRSMLTPAVLGRALQASAGRTGPGPRLSPRASTWLARAASTASFIELVVDKLPHVPARTAPLPMLGRVLSGGAAGFVTGAERRRNIALWTALGAASALVAAGSSYRLRRYAIQRAGLSSATSGMLEDTLALLAARWLGQRLEQ